LTPKPTISTNSKLLSGKL